MFKRDTAVLWLLVLTLERLVTKLEAEPEYIPHSCGLCCGLCRTLGRLSGVAEAKASRLVQAASVSWPKRYLGLGSESSLSGAFPVGGPDEYYRGRESDSLWIGEQREMRISLAKHVLSWIWFNPGQALRIIRGYSRA